MNIKYQPATLNDAQGLAELRVSAMQPSLEAIGRFDAVRARERFLSAFEPASTTVIVLDSKPIGFYVVKTKPDCLWLDHLYVLPKNQGSGIGVAAMANVKEQANQLNLPLRLCALRDSPANDFYQAQGFQFQYEEQWDIYYEYVESQPKT